MELDFTELNAPNPTPPPSATPSEATDVSLGLGWSASLEGRRGGATLRLRHPEQGSMAVQITMTADGPVTRASAAALEIDAAEEIVARCERFTLEARQRLVLRSAEITQECSGTHRIEARAVEVEAIAGDVRIQANDDVQVLGEQVLLNCGPEEPLPGWLSQPPPAEATIARQDAIGDTSLFAEVRGPATPK